MLYLKPLTIISRICKNNWLKAAIVNELDCLVIAAISGEVQPDDLHCQPAAPCISARVQI